MGLWRSAKILLAVLLARNTKLSHLCHVIIVYVLSLEISTP